MILCICDKPSMQKAVVHLTRMSTPKCHATACGSPTSIEFVKCKICSLSYHTTCADVKKTGLAAMKENTNIVWHCAHCINSSVSESASSLLSCTKAVADMVTRFGPILDAFATISQTAIRDQINGQQQQQLQQQTPTTPSIVAIAANNKRVFSEVAEDDSADQPKKLNRTVIKPTTRKPSVKFGTKASSSGLTAVARPATRNSHSPKYDRDLDTHKHLYVSRLQPQTTEEEILSYIKTNAKLSSSETLRCKILVPAGKKVDELNFVSFKISATIDDFTILANPNIWPQNVAVREFNSTPKTTSFFNQRSREDRN